MCRLEKWLIFAFCAFFTFLGWLASGLADEELNQEGAAVPTQENGNGNNRYSKMRMAEWKGEVGADIKTIKKTINDDRTARIAERKEFWDALKERDKELRSELKNVEDCAVEARDTANAIRNKAIGLSLGLTFALHSIWIGLKAYFSSKN